MVVVTTIESLVGVEVAKLVAASEEGFEGKSTTYKKKEPSSIHLKSEHRGSCRRNTCEGLEVRAQSLLKTMLIGSGQKTPVVFRAQAPVEFGGQVDSCRDDARRKFQTHSDGLRQEKKIQCTLVSVTVAAAKPKVTGYLVLLCSVGCCVKCLCN